MTSHNPVNFLTSLGLKLAARSRHVCFFLGAGASRAAGLPDMVGLQKIVLSGLDEDEKRMFEKLLNGRNIESALTHLRRIQAVLESGQDLDGITAEIAKRLDNNICSLIVSALDLDAPDLIPARKFALWVGRAVYDLPIEIFTVNYDLLLERAFDKHRVLYFDGFSGTTEARFQISLTEAVFGIDRECVPSFYARLWKLHGSVNWAWRDGEIVRCGHTVKDAAAIYPSDLKYEQSRRFPFVVLHDRFRRALSQPETILIIAGYSFGDQHLNELIYDAASRRQRSEVIALCYGDLNAEAVKQAMSIPNLQLIGTNEAVISCKKGAWAIGVDETCEYFSGDEFLLPDFSWLSSFLSKISPRVDETDPSLKELFALIAKASASDPANGDGK